jgi:hypothetical protein
MAALGFFETAPRLRQESRAFRGEPDAPRGALKEPRAESFLQPSDAIAEGCRRKRDALGRRPKARARSSEAIRDRGACAGLRD